jgi:hypothetical protein
MKIRFAIAAFVSFLGGNASAAVVTYTATTTAGGLAGANGFGGQIKVVSVADTATKQACLGPVTDCYVVINTSTSIEISGLGVFNLTNPSYTFVNNGSGLFGFGEVNPSAPGFLNSFLFLNNVFDPIPTSTALANYDLVSSLGPVTTNGIANNFFAPVIFTDGGAISFSVPRSAIAMFQATVAQSVPEPATWALMIAGFSLAGCTLRRRKNIRLTSGFVVTQSGHDVA